MTVGKVYLVGAGPGDPGLITVRGKDCLARADVVIADYLVHPGLLALSPATAEVFVRPQGRRGYCGRQEEIHDLLITSARAGKTVVRLKGGDPFLFGRGGEEVETLFAAGIDFEVVPGVTAALGVAAYAGIPLTHRGVSGVVAFVTGHETDQKADGDVDWVSVARGATTLVLYMSVAQLSRVIDNLVAAGRRADEPVAVIEHGTLPGQRTFRATIGTVVELANRAGVRSPAITIVGRVTDLGIGFNWFDRQPLRGRRLLVLTSKAAPMLEGTLGAEIHFFSPFEVVHHFSSVKSVLARLGQFSVIAFTSEHAVEVVVGALLSVGQDARSLAGMRLVCVGDATARRLAQMHLSADLVTHGGADELAQAIIAAPWSGPVLYPRAAQVSAGFVEHLRNAQVAVEEVIAYETVLRKEALARFWRESVAWDAILATSPRGVEALWSSFPDVTQLASMDLGAIGRSTQEAFANQGAKQVWLASQAKLNVFVAEALQRLHRSYATD